MEDGTWNLNIVSIKEGVHIIFLNLHLLQDCPGLQISSTWLCEVERQKCGKAGQVQASEDSMNHFTHTAWV